MRKVNLISLIYSIDYIHNFKLFSRRTGGNAWLTNQIVGHRQFLGSEMSDVGKHNAVYSIPLAETPNNMVSAIGFSSKLKDIKNISAKTSKKAQLRTRTQERRKNRHRKLINISIYQALTKVINNWNHDALNGPIRKKCNDTPHNQT